MIPTHPFMPYEQWTGGFSAQLSRPPREFIGTIIIYRLLVRSCAGSRCASSAASRAWESNPEPSTAPCARARVSPLPTPLASSSLHSSLRLQPILYIISYDRYIYRATRIFWPGNFASSVTRGACDYFCPAIGGARLSLLIISNNKSHYTKNL